MYQSEVRNNSEKSAGAVTLRYIVRNMQNRFQSYSNIDFQHYLQLVIDAVSYLNNITLDTIETSWITIGDTNALELPNDYLDYVKIGVVDANGRVWTLTLNPELVRYPLETCGLPLDKVLNGTIGQFPNQYPIPEQGYWFTSAFHYGNTIPVQYSLGGGFNKGYYNIDRQGRYLLVSGLPKGTVICLEYKSTGVKIGETTYVPRQAMEAIIAWVMMTKQAHGMQASVNWEQKFYTEEALLANLEYTRTAEEYKDLFYSVWQQGPKR